MYYFICTVLFVCFVCLVDRLCVCVIQATSAVLFDVPVSFHFISLVIIGCWMKAIIHFCSKQCILYLLAFFFSLCDDDPHPLPLSPVCILYYKVGPSIEFTTRFNEKQDMGRRVGETRRCCGSLFGQRSYANHAKRVC